MAYGAQPPPDSGNAAPAEGPALPSHSDRLRWIDDWDESTFNERRECVRDREYYDGVQWTREEVAALRKRRQPIITKNRIARKINFVLGEEIKKRVDPTALPKEPSHRDDANVAIDALRYVEERQRFDKVRTAVFRSMLVEGIGAARKWVDEEGEFQLSHVEWDRIMWDPTSRAPDFSDAKYLGVIMWMDLEDAIDQWPDAADMLSAAVGDNEFSATNETTEDTPRNWHLINETRQRVKVCELYFNVSRNWYKAILTQAGDIRSPAPTPYLNERQTRSICPLVMMSCYVDRDGNRRGVVRDLRSPQDEINKRSSKLLHELSVTGVVAERDSIRDPNKFLDELAKPDGYSEVEPGMLNNIMLREKLSNINGHLALLQEAKADIDTIGPSSSTLPELPEAASGRAFIARMQAAAQELGAIFDQLRDWSLTVYRLDWACIRQTWTEEKWVRVTDDRKGYRFVALNRQMLRAQRFMELVQDEDEPMPPEEALPIAAGEYSSLVMSAAQQRQQATLAQLQQQIQMITAQGGQPPPQAMQIAQQVQSPQFLIQAIIQHPLMQEPVTLNQVAQMDVDIQIEVAPDTATIEQEQFSALADLMAPIAQLRPDIAEKLVRLMVEFSSQRHSDAIKALVDELDKGPDPQQQQAQQQAQQIQQMAATTQIEETKSKTQLNQARAANEQAEAQQKGAMAPLEAEKMQASAMHDAARAGSLMGEQEMPL